MILLEQGTGMYKINYFIVRRYSGCSSCWEGCNVQILILFTLLPSSYYYYYYIPYIVQLIVSPQWIVDAIFNQWFWDGIVLRQYQSKIIEMNCILPTSINTPTPLTQIKHEVRIDLFESNWRYLAKRVGYLQYATPCFM